MFFFFFWTEKRKNMLFNFIREFFYQTNCGRNAESVTTTIVDYNDQQQFFDNNDVMLAFDEGKLSETDPLALDGNQQLPKTKLNNNTNSDYNNGFLQRQSLGINQNQNNHKNIDLSIFSIYLFFGILFLFICTINVLLLIYINKVTDLNQLRDSLKNDFMDKSDINLIIQTVLKDIEINGDTKIKHKQTRYVDKIIFMCASVQTTYKIQITIQIFDTIAYPHRVSVHFSQKSEQRQIYETHAGLLNII